MSSLTRRISTIQFTSADGWSGWHLPPANPAKTFWLREHASVVEFSFTTASLPHSRGRRRSSTEEISDVKTVLSAVTWDENLLSLEDFAEKFSLPQLARVVKGQYIGIGAPSLASPHLISNIFVLPGGKKAKVAAQCVKFKDTHGKVIPIGTKLAIPDSYSGWFEILSEDGRAAKVIDGVAELAKKFPDSCILRESLKVWTGKGDGSESITARWKVLPAGDKIVLVGRVCSDGSHVDASSAFSKSGENVSRNHFLRCFEPNGKSVYFRLDQKGKFSPVAKDTGVAGVHTIEQLIKKRFPLMVRLVHGCRPPGCKTFVPEMRLYASYEENCIFALPLRATKRFSADLVALAPSAQIKLHGPKNYQHVLRLPDYERMARRCQKLVSEANEHIQVFDITLSKQLPSIKNGWKSKFIRRSLSDSITMEVSTSDKLVHDRNYDEIDEIYDYVRGFLPLPKAVAVEHPVAPSDSKSPPIPPPIETIPIRRHSVPLTQNRKASALDVGRRYLRSPAQSRQKQRFVRQSKCQATSKAVSPFFHMRYKSLTDLASMDATSSNSTESGGSVPTEKRSRPRLVRPRSLTDLLFNVKGNTNSDNAPFLGTLYL